MGSKSIFDCHLHYVKGWPGYDLNIESGNVIFNSIKEYKDFSHEVRDRFCTSIVFDYRNHFDYVCRQIDDGLVSALKIHSRIQRISMQDLDSLLNYLDKVPIEIPIIYDAFYYGH